MNEQNNRLTFFQKNVFLKAFLLTILLFSLNSYSCFLDSLSDGGVAGLVHKCALFSFHLEGIIALLIPAYLFYFIPIFLAFLGMFVFFYIFIYYLEKRTSKFKTVAYFLMLFAILIFAFSNLIYDSNVFSNSELKCKLLRGYYNKANCYHNLALKRKDVSLCEKIGFYSANSEIKECVIYVAIAKNNASICENFVNDPDLNSSYDYREWCYQEFGFRKKDASICENITSYFGKKDQCYQYLSSWGIKK